MADSRSEGPSTATGAPTWLKVLGVALLLAVLVVIVGVVAGGGGHMGPPPGGH